MADAWHDLSHEMVWAPRTLGGLAHSKNGKGGKADYSKGMGCGSAVAGNLGAPRRVQTTCPRSVSSSNDCAELVPAAPRLRPPPAAAGPPTPGASGGGAPGGAPAWRSAANTRSDLPNNLRTLMMKCDMSDINFICF